MTPRETYAQHRSWRCWLRWDDSGSPLLELVWQISGMVPRVLLQAERVPDLPPEEWTLTERSSKSTVGPSGHIYQAGLSADLLEVADAALNDWQTGQLDPGAWQLTAGSDIDTSEVILKRALDLLRHVVDSLPGSLDPEDLHAMLRERSDVWASW